MQQVYLDNNATTQPTPEVVAAVREAHENLWANPSSLHRPGQVARQRVELARADVAAMLNCRDRELVFTSGGTESNSLALWGVLGRTLRTKQNTDKNPPRGVLITTRTEHAAIRQPAERMASLGVNVEYLPIDQQGCVAAEALTQALEHHADGNTLTLVSVHWANNETGVVQPIHKLAQACRDHHARHNDARVLFHTDATQAVGKTPVDVEQAGVDLLTLSAHKFHGPKGVGALYVRSGVRLEPQNLGGPQERERRGGTENTPGIIALGVAAQQTKRFLDDSDQIVRLTAMRDRFENAVAQRVPGVVINAKAPASSHATSAATMPPSQRLWNTSNVGFPGLEAEAILLGLSERGVCASAGAACSSGSLEPSPVLLAMGVPEPVAHGSVRFSLSRFTTDHEIDTAIRVITEVVEKLAKTMPMSTK